MEKLERVDVEGGFYLRSHDAVVDDDAVIGAGSKIWSGAHIFADAKIGNGCIVGAGVYVENDVILGNYCKVQRGVTLYKGVKAEDYVFFGPNATTTNDRNPRAFGAWDLSPTYFETGASIGANATVIAGNRVGAFALVAAAGVVTRSVQPFEAVAGNPARHHGWVDIEGAVISKAQQRPSLLNKYLLDPVGSLKKYIEESSNER